MKFEYQTRFFSILVVVTAGRSPVFDPLEIIQSDAKQDFELRRVLWQRSVEAIKNEPPKTDP